MVANGKDLVWTIQSMNRKLFWQSTFFLWTTIVSKNVFAPEAEKLTCRSNYRKQNSF